MPSLLMPTRTFHSKDCARRAMTQHRDDKGDQPLRQHLASVAANLRDGTLDADDAAWLSNALTRIADGKPADIELGLRYQRADMLAAIKARDCILRGAALIMMPGLPLIEAANRIHRAMLRYRESAWQRERQLDTCPPRYRGTLREMAWQALRLWDAVPSASRIRRILAEGRRPMSVSGGKADLSQTSLNRRE
jgi:hypothetical protein